ncbi:MAG: metallophosphoesterase [Thermoguttaceae bacterium]|jgi:predicted MPP superfamily phosphohydrolase|nr:metallophosphoesterase [Thermoguttaceae bacterium]
MLLPILLIAILGHVLLWVAIVNRAHGLNLPRQAGHAASLSCLVLLITIPTIYGWWIHVSGWAVFLQSFRIWPIPNTGQILAMLYMGVCVVMAVLAVTRWGWRNVLSSPPGVVRSQSSRTLSLRGVGEAVISEEHAHHFLVHLPGNEILHLDLSERAIDVPRLPAVLDGFSIVHLSDFHFTGRIGKAYFREVVRLANQTQPDLIAITGDLIDDLRCLDWIPDTFGQLTARHGVYFILGNHDLWIDCDRIRTAMVESGLIDLGGRWLTVEARGEQIVLAGNELPWMAPAADMRDAPQRTANDGPIRIVLSHSPDQLDWARVQDADLLLAGHTHGGQIRLPFLGAMLTPSQKGVRYASGIFYAPPTVMHVTRGVSGEFPVRLNCPPEMAHLVLHALEKALPPLKANPG